MGSFIYYVCKIFRKCNISYALIRTLYCYGNFAYVPDEWPQCEVLCEFRCMCVCVLIYHYMSFKANNLFFFFMKRTLLVLSSHMNSWKSLFAWNDGFALYKKLQIESFFWSILSYVWAEYGHLWVGLRIQSECKKIRTKKGLVFGHFSRSNCIVKMLFM